MSVELNGLRHAFNYLLFRRGPLSSSAVQAMAWVRSDPALAQPDVHLNFFPFGIDFTVSPPVMHKRAAVGIGSILSRPHSRGRVGLRSKDPLDGPLIEHRAFEDERDMAALVRSVALIERLFEAPPLAGAVTGTPHNPADSGRSVAELIRAYGSMGLHSVGTCRMGSDADAVVDPALRVFGVDGLRVVDASVMPRLISANTNAAAIMIGERGADFIKHDLA